MTTRERGLIFSAPSVRAILAGKKTQTRRIVRIKDYAQEQPPWRRSVAPETAPVYPHECPYGREGDRLWVREPWRMGKTLDHLPGSKIAPGRRGIIHYAADGEPELLADQFGRYRSGRYMPRWAARITLEIIDVRVQRVQEISEADALAEGGWDYRNTPIHKSPERSFAELWDSINAERGYDWASNPWTWAITFRLKP